MLFAKTKKYKQDFNDPWNFLFHAPPRHSINPHQICLDMLLQGIVFIKCCILMQKDEQHPVSRIVHSQLTPTKYAVPLLLRNKKSRFLSCLTTLGNSLFLAGGSGCSKACRKCCQKRHEILSESLLVIFPRFFKAISHKTIEPYIAPGSFSLPPIRL